MVIEELYAEYLQPPLPGSTSCGNKVVWPFQRAVVELYQLILLYQIQATLRLSRNKVVQTLRDSLQLDSLTSCVQRIKVSEEHCEKYFNHINQSALREQLQAQNDAIEQGASQILREVHDLNHHVLDLQQKQHQRALTSEERQCHQVFLPEGIDYKSQKDQNPKPVPGTCLWALRNQKYTQWRDDNTKKLLWISADPGCGKSVLARCIIDEDLPKHTSSFILYFFFKDTSTEQRSGLRAISTVLHQLFAVKPQLIHHALPHFRQAGSKLPTQFHDMWSILMLATADPSAGDIMCIFDALDECDEQDQPRLMRALEDFCFNDPGSTSPSCLKFLVTSRPYFEIKSGFHDLLTVAATIELAGTDESESIRQEIDLVIKHRVRNIAKKLYLPENVRDHLEARLLMTENRTYLWLRLLWEVIEKTLSGTISELNELIDNLPASIEDAYEALLRKCPNTLFARKVLQIIIAAHRPLTLDEMDAALRIEKQSSYAELELEGPFRLQETLPSRCGLTISIVQSKIYLIHQTVKEFLLTKDGTPTPGVWKQSFSSSESNSLLEAICLQSLTFSEIDLDRLNLWNAVLSKKARVLNPNAYCQIYAFLSYSAIYWADHCRDSKSSKTMQTIKYLLKTVIVARLLIVLIMSITLYAPRQNQATCW